METTVCTVGGQVGKERTAEKDKRAHVLYLRIWQLSDDAHNLRGNIFYKKKLRKTYIISDLALCHCSQSRPSKKKIFPCGNLLFV